MSGEQSCTEEKSTLDKKPKWGGALVGRHHRQQHAHFHRPQQQNLQQTQQPFADHQLLAGGCLDSATCHFEHSDAIIDAGSVQHNCHFNTAADGRAHYDNVDMGSAHAHIRSASGRQQEHTFGMATPDIAIDKSSVNIATGPHRAKSIRDHVGHIGQGSSSLSMPIKMPTTRRTRNASVSSLTVRPAGTKDRHSKVRTAKGLRDRRVRLSAPTAIQFFDVQDRLGYDQPSKAVEWLIKKARAAIDELAPVEAVAAGDETTQKSAQDQKGRKDHHVSSIVNLKDEEQGIPLPSGSGMRAESRAKARERARERSKEKSISSCGVSSPAATSGQEVTIITSAVTTPTQPFMPAASSHLHFSLPEFFLLSGQLRQPFPDQQLSTDLSSTLSQIASSTLAPHFVPLSTHFFPGLPQGSVSAYIHSGVDAPQSFQFSAPPVYTNTPISPRGTLQSIFSDPANSFMQPHMPIAQRSMSMIGAMQQAHLYGTTLNSVVEGRHYNDEETRQRSAELGSPNLHQHSRIPMRIHGMELDSHIEETRITTSSMQADFQ